MNQISFAEAEYTQKRRTTRREKFLLQMEQLIPREMLNKKIKPHYPNNGKADSPSRCPRCYVFIACSYFIT